MLNLAVATLVDELPGALQVGVAERGRREGGRRGEGREKV